MAKWHKTKYPGVRYREHSTRKHGVNYDRYFAVRYTINGKQREEALGWASEGWTPQNAAEELARLKRAQRTGEGAYTLKEKREQEDIRRKAEEKKKRQEELNNITLADFWPDYMNGQHKSERSLISERSHYENWLTPILGSLPLKDIKPFHLEKVKKKMLDAGKSPRTVQYAFATFRQVWNAARLKDIVTEESPSKKVRLPKFDNKRLRFLTREEADRLLAELKTKSQRVYNISLLSLHTGMRAGEIFNLTWGDVSLDNETLTIRDSKSGKTRYVYLTRKTKSMLAGLYQGQGPSDLVFKNDRGGKITEISNTFERAANDIGLNNGVTDARQKVTFHTLRHTFASWLVQSGTDLYTVKELLGHHSIQLTERYSHLRPDGLKKAIKDFEDQHQSKVINLAGQV
ncbi:MAG: tyrosine-type recombinase/integrase [Thermodesulfobacteriota bacterium]